MSYDSRESGVAYLAVTAGSTEEVRERFKDAWDGLEWIEMRRDFPSITSEDFQEQGWWACLVPPIPLWKLSVDLRTDLLTGDLFFAVVYSPDVLRRALTLLGVRMNEEADGITFALAEKELFLPKLDARRLILGMAFGGVSPTEVAQTIVRLLGRSGGLTTA
jgi:hypothetical protein